MGQFERTLIIVDEGAEVHYVEGCTAPMYTTESLHSAVVEVDGQEKRHAVATPRSRTGRTTSTTSLPSERWRTKTRLMEWIDGNLGSQADHEVSGRLHDGAGGPWRDPVDRVFV